MKRKTIIVVTFIFFASALNAQEPDPKAVFISHKVAKKMTDTLRLTAEQRIQIQQINMQLHNQKEVVRQQTSIPDSLTARMQRIENTRDSLYLPVIGSSKFPAYLEKKRNLVTN